MNINIVKDTNSETYKLQDEKGRLSLGSYTTFEAAWKIKEKKLLEAAGIAQTASKA